MIRTLTLRALVILMAVLMLVPSMSAGVAAEQSEPIVIRYLRPGSSSDSPENARIKAKIEEEFEKSTGIKVDLDLYFYDWDVVEEKYMMDIASGNAPDLVRLPSSMYMKYWFKGHFQPLNDAVDQYCPNLYKRFDEGEIRTATVDGKLVGFPLGGKPINTIMILRQDKLDALGMEMPTTIDELEAVFAAYKAEHPDEAPYMAYWTAGIKYIAALCGLPGMGGADKYMREDGTVTVAYMHPDQERFLEVFSKWYKNGWVSKDILTAGEEAEGQYIQDKGLTVISYAEYGLDFIKQTKEGVNPDATGGVVPQLTTPWGDATIAFDGFNNEGYLGVPRNVSAEKLSVIAQLVNWELENADNFWLTKRGEKGIDYDIVDGMMTTPEQWTVPGAQPYDWEYWFIPSVFMNGGELNIPEANANPGTEEIFEQIRTAKYIDNPVLATPYLPLDEIATQFDAATKALGELQSEIIVGIRPLEDWDQAAKIWADNGGLELEAKMTEVYNSLTK